MMKISPRRALLAIFSASLLLATAVPAAAAQYAPYPSYQPPAYNAPPEQGQGCGYAEAPRYRNRVDRYADPYRYDRGYHRSYRPYRGYRRPHRRSGWGGMPWGGRRGGNNFFGGDGFKDRMSDSWDDMLNAPSRSGRMPGGWNAPSMDVPNPIDVTDEFDRNFRDMPNNFNSK